MSNPGSLSSKLGGVVKSSDYAVAGLRASYAKGVEALEPETGIVRSNMYCAEKSPTYALEHGQYTESIHLKDVGMPSG